MTRIKVLTSIKGLPTDVPVPCNVTSVYVQFDFSVTDIRDTQWILDAVQLRPVPWDPVCCLYCKGVS